MKILFEDQDITVCIKPDGLLSQDDFQNRKSMVTELAKLCNSEIFPVHRLDREVGGVMVYAKTAFVAAKLSCQIADRTFQKEYIALIQGRPSEIQGEMIDLLFKDSQRNKSFVVKKNRKGVKEASLEYKVLETYDTQDGVISKVRIKLHTGRTHQIRVQFSSRKMPILGDRRYGGLKKPKLYLWSHMITFNHPTTNQTLSFCEEPQF